MAKDRRSIAAEIITTLKRELANAEVSLRGSVASGADDALSDIDILVEHDVASDAVVADDVVRALYKIHPVLFHDFAKGFLPDECVVSFFIEGVALHSIVEVAIVVDKANRVLTADTVQQNYPEHFIKMWVIASKKLARQQNNFELNYLVHHLLPHESHKQMPAIGLLKLALAAISATVKNNYPELYQSCESYLLSLEQVVASNVSHDRC